MKTNESGKMGRVMRKQFLGIVASIGLAAPVAAGPDATTNYLIGEPASLLDMGFNQRGKRISYVG